MPLLNAGEATATAIAIVITVAIAAALVAVLGLATWWVVIRLWRGIRGLQGRGTVNESSRERTLDQRESGVAQAEKDLHTRQGELERREAAITVQESAMRSRTRALDEQQSSIDETAKDAHAREAMAVEREAELVRREAGVTSAQAHLEPSAASLEASANTLNPQPDPLSPSRQEHERDHVAAAGTTPLDSPVIKQSATAASSIIFEETATYEGGHPKFLKKSRGKLALRADGLEFQSGKSHFVVAIHDVVECDLRPMQFSTLRSIVGGTARAIQTQTPMAHLTCFVEGHEYELRFHIGGALTVPGESENARKFKDALYTLAPSFATSSDASAALPDAASHDDSADITELLRQLAALKAEGILSEEEFVTKKAELLDRL